ncbi:DUF2267 domain-containing protein [Streptomyces sp. YC504]|uniref:DUF2267 domain-containing protein n=1 Tax=Streptomyces mesophilus TaxID=1775132 RepID=A0A6G4XHD8_9ACTN|nr:DUF2267 domain-containing protein [Streptomyces mesophilus]NGO76818.1 DUF2267 domain-containing protein [Streptomyces mesophilus]
MDSSLQTLLADITDRGGYDRHEEAARALHQVLEVLGSHLVGDDRTDLARLLPEQCGPVLTGSEPASEPLTPTAFIDAVAQRGNDEAADARRAVNAVLAALAALADDALLRRILIQLPPGHAGLFGRIDPV